MIRHLNEREEKILLVCLAAICSAVLYHALIIPLEERKDFLHQEIAIRQERLDRELKILQKAESLNGLYDTYIKQFRRFDTKEEAVSVMLSEIEETAGRLGLHVTDLKPQKVEDDEYSHQFSVSLTIKSELVDIVRFIYTLQQQPHLFDVVKIDLEQYVRRNQKAIMTRLVLKKAFILPESDEAKTSEQERGALL